MVKSSDLAEKEVITIKEGRNLGPIIDMEIDLERGKVEAIVMPGQDRFFGIFGRENDMIIPWKDIVKIGTDVILIEHDGTHGTERE